MYDAFDPSRLTHATSVPSISALPCLLLGSWSLHLRCALTDSHSTTSCQAQEQDKFRRLTHKLGSPKTFGHFEPAWTLFTTHNTRNSYHTNHTGGMLQQWDRSISTWSQCHSSRRPARFRRGNGYFTPNHANLAHSGHQTHTMWILNPPLFKEHKASDLACEPVHLHPGLLHPDKGDDQDLWTRNGYASL